MSDCRRIPAAIPNGSQKGYFIRDAKFIDKIDKQLPIRSLANDIQPPIRQRTGRFAKPSNEIIHAFSSVKSANCDDTRLLDFYRLGSTVGEEIIARRVVRTVDDHTQSCGLIT